MGKTPPKEKEAEGSPRKKAPRVDDAAPTTVPVASAPSPTRKTPPKGDEVEGSPRKKAPRLDDAAPGAPEPNPTGEAEGSWPKRSRSPRNKSPRRQDKRPAAAVPLPTVPESSDPIVEGAGRASDEKRCECSHVITESVVEEMESSLWSEDALTCYGCGREDKEKITRVRPEKSDLLFCVTCYDHLCCEVGSIAYPFGHSRAHALEEKHWFAVKYCDPESGYCFKCNAKVSMVGLQKLMAPLPSVGQTEAEINPKKLEMTGKVQATSQSSDAQGYAIRGISNLGSTCYMSAVLQCLFVLGKLQERMLALDHPKSGLAKALKKLFVKASAAGNVLNPKGLLKCIPRFSVGTMQDSHEFLMALRDIWREDEKSTMIDSIFGFEMLQTLSCKKCGPSLLASFSNDLKLDFPSKWHPTKSSASPQTSKGPRSRKRETVVQLFPADVLRNFEKMQIVSESGYSHVIGSEEIVEGTHKPLEVDSTQAQRISQRKDAVQSPLQIQKGKCVDSLTEDSISIEDLLLLFCACVVKCLNCAKDHEEPSASQSKNCDQIVGSSNKDDVGDTVKTSRFTTLPPVLTLHLNRTSYLEGTFTVENMGGNIVGTKISCHVRFMEYLDVRLFRDPSTDYRLAGVVEHIGEGPLDGEYAHYIAYVRARKLGNQQEGRSCSSSWFRADDSRITQVTLEQVLNCEAFILFYERMEDQDISGIRRQN